MLGKIVDFFIRPVADDKPLIGVEHRQPARHVVERELQAAIELC